MVVECTVVPDACGLRVELSGRLGLSDMAAVHLVLLRCLAEQPDALLVDLSGLTVDEPASLDVLQVLSQQAHCWPDVPLLLCAPPSATRDLLHHVVQPVLVFGTAAAARDHAVAHREPLDVLGDELLPLAGAPRHARDLATDACVRWDLPHLAGPAALVVTELVSNVIDHAGTMCTLRFTLQRQHLTVSVRDGSTREPVMARVVPPQALRGRGLMLVDAVADEWGWLPADGGKVVWAALAR